MAIHLGLRTTHCIQTEMEPVTPQRRPTASGCLLGLALHMTARRLDTGWEPTGFRWVDLSLPKTYPIPVWLLDFPWSNYLNATLDHLQCWFAEFPFLSGC